MHVVDDQPSGGDTAKHTVTGTLDAADIDRIGDDGKNSAVDLQLRTARRGRKCGLPSDTTQGTVDGNEYSEVNTDRTEATEARENQKHEAGNRLIKLCKKGTYGTLTVNKFTGAWTYVLDNTFDATQTINGGDSETDTFRILVTDEEGAQYVDVLTITVNGTDDAPVISVGSSRFRMPERKKSADSDGNHVGGNTPPASSTCMMMTPTPKANRGTDSSAGETINGCNTGHWLKASVPDTKPFREPTTAMPGRPQAGRTAMVR